MLKNITSSKNETIKFMQKVGILRNCMQCPGPLIGKQRAGGCGKQMQLKSTTDRSDGLIWRCRKTHKISKDNKNYVVKDVKVSIREDSWIIDAKISLEVIIELIYLWSQGFSPSEIEHELQISNKTVIEWSAYLREVCVSTVMDNSCAIGGDGVEVEIDESKFGKRKYHRGHRVDGQWVFGGREKNDHTKIFMIPVHNRKEVTLLPLIQKWIKPGSIIHSDCWKAYTNLAKKGYHHITVNHSKEFINTETGACTNGIEGDWRHAKASIPRYGIHKGLHAGYLGEFMWRRRYKYTDKFLSLIEHINSNYHKEIIKQSPQ